MAIKISNNTVIDDNRRGIFLKVNPGTYATGSLPTALEGDFVYDNDEQTIKVYTGSEWK